MRDLKWIFRVEGCPFWLWWRAEKGIMRVGGPGLGKEAVFEIVSQVSGKAVEPYGKERRGGHENWKGMVPLKSEAVVDFVRRMEVATNCEAELVDTVTGRL